MATLIQYRASWNDISFRAEAYDFSLASPPILRRLLAGYTPLGLVWMGIAGQILVRDAFHHACCIVRAGVRPSTDLSSLGSEL